MFEEIKSSERIGTLGFLASGQRVIDRHNSHIHENIRQILPEILQEINTDKDFIKQEIDIGRKDFENICVETTDEDEIIFAKRKYRDGFTRFVKNRQPEKTSKITIILKKTQEEDTYFIVTAFSGSGAEVEPWDRQADSKSIHFWNNHALIWDGKDVDENTITEKCPW
jgi:hypothetical protein